MDDMEVEGMEIMLMRFVQMMSGVIITGQWRDARAWGIERMIWRLRVWRSC